MGKKNKSRKRNRDGETHQQHHHHETKDAGLQGNELRKSTSLGNLGTSTETTLPSYARKKESLSIAASTLKNTGKKYLTPQDGLAFENLVSNHYQGFVHVPADQIPSPDFHERAKSAFERLRDASYYQYDIVKAGGKHASRTFVKRTLVGEPGITYKYLGLRLFAHAWSGPGVLPIMKAIGNLNQEMTNMTKSYGNSGRCDYNLTLINFMEPSSHAKVGFKDEAFYDMGKVSVSWHADSSLESNSSIGVYHCLPSQRAAKWDWRIGLRRIPDSDELANQVPPIVTSTKDGDVYFLLGTFNETHQHCVLSGSEAHRISSTHRVAVTKEDTFEYIKKRAKGAIKRFRLQLDGDLSKVDPKVIVYCQRVLSEIEFEWIAQYWLQGADHDRLRVWWQRPMRILEEQWVSLEKMTLELYHLIRENPTKIPRLALKGLLVELQSRHEQRQQWDERRSDKIYQRRIQESYRPVERPVFDGTIAKETLGKDLTQAIETIVEFRKQVRGTEEDVPTGTKGNRKSPVGSKTISKSPKWRAPQENTGRKKKRQTTSG